MPELPELEALVRDLGPGIIGRMIESVGVIKPKLFNAWPGLTLEDLFGRKFERVWRRGKFTVWELSGDLSLVVHLKLAGQMVHVTADGQELAHGGHPVPMWGTPLPHKSSHVVFRLDDGSTLYLTDIRQFARLTLLPDTQVAAFLKKQKIGPEPLTRRFTAEELYRRLQRRSIPLKTTIMDQSVVGGIGNIYADESLWRARLHPRLPAHCVTLEEAKRLHRAIRWVLDYAVREGAAFVPHGKAISDRDFPYVHGRAGSPCPRHPSTIIQKEWVGGRGTHFCPRCQKLATARRVQTSGARGQVTRILVTPDPRPLIPR
jgi:formamidopyrimidine-DNA glycosylase